MLDAIVSPLGTDRFLADHWERDFLHITRNDAAHFASLVGLEDIDRELARSDVELPDVRAVQADQDLPREAFAKANGRVDSVKLYKCFAAGATIILNQAHRRIPALAALCRSLEAELSIPFQTNLYLTPPNAQGFRVHYDSHDVFALQVVGSKDWLIYGTHVALPTRGQAFDPDEAIDKTLRAELTARSGDTLYIPRGILHEARSRDEVSLHVTLGALGRTWAEFLLEAVAQVCLDRPELRRTLPVGYARADFDPADMERAFREHVAGIAGAARFGDIHARFVDEFVRSREPPVAGQLAHVIDIAALAGETPLRLRPGTVFRREDLPDAVALNYAGRNIRFPPFCRAPLERALSGATVTAADLPGDLDGQGRLALVRRLVTEGLLEPA